MAQGTYAPNPVFLGEDNNGLPISGGKLFIYTAGTTTKATTWSDIPMTVPNADPLILDSAGRGTVVLLPGAAYKFVLAPATDTDPPTSPIWTRDNVAAVPPPATATDNDITGTAGENIAAGDAVYLSDGSGGLTAGRWYRGDATNIYSSSGAPQVGMAPSAISVGVAGSVRLAGRITGLTGRTTGQTYFIAGTPGQLAALSSVPANARAIAQADSSTSVVVSPWAQMTAPQFWGPPVYRQGSPVGQQLSNTYDAVVNGKIGWDHIQKNGATGAGTDCLTSGVGGGIISANTMSSQGKMVRIVAHGTLAANANNKTMTFSWNGSSAFSFPTVVLNGYTWELVIEIFRTGAVNAQTMLYKLFFAPLSGAGTGVVYGDRAAKSVSLQTDIPVKLTIISGTTLGDITFDAGYIEVIG